MLTNSSYQDKLNTMGQKYNGNLAFVNVPKYDSFPTNSNDSIDRKNATKLPATLNLHPINYANNTSNYLSDSPGQATGSEGEKKRLVQMNQGTVHGGDSPEPELSMANIK